jgi:hypothetical protein
VHRFQPLIVGERLIEVLDNVGEVAVVERAKA